jgi:hypothetical protein
VGRGGFGVVRDVTSIQLLSSQTPHSAWRNRNSNGGFGGAGSEGTNTTAASNGSGTTGSGGAGGTSSFGIKAGSGHSIGSGRTALRLFRQTSKDMDEPDAANAISSGVAAAATTTTTTTTTITREQLARRVWANKKKKGGKYVLKEVECAQQDGETKTAGQTHMKGTMDLAMEARFLASLSHPYILELRGLAADSSAVSALQQHNNSSDGETGTTTTISAGQNYNYFIIVDKLQETLPKRLNAWMHRDRACKGITGALTSIGGMVGKNRRKELLMDRILVAHDIASAMCYLHGKNIIYVSIFVSFCFDERPKATE